MQANAPAIRLYEKPGYEELYPYWYRVQGSVPMQTVTIAVIAFMSGSLRMGLDMSAIPLI